MTRTSLHTAKNTDKVRWRDHSNFFPNPPTDGTFVLITPKYVAKKKERKKKSASDISWYYRANFGFLAVGLHTVSYTHLTLPTNAEV